MTACGSHAFKLATCIVTCPYWGHWYCNFFLILKLLKFDIWKLYFVTIFVKRLTNPVCPVDSMTGTYLVFHKICFQFLPLVHDPLTVNNFNVWLDRRNFHTGKKNENHGNLSSIIDKMMKKRGTKTDPWVTRKNRDKWRFKNSCALHKIYKIIIIKKSQYAPCTFRFRLISEVSLVRRLFIPKSSNLLIMKISNPSNNGSKFNRKVFTLLD